MSERNPIQFLVQHMETILTAYRRTGSPLKTWEALVTTLPGLTEEMKLPTFKQYVGVLAALVEQLHKDTQGGPATQHDTQSSLDTQDTQRENDTHLATQLEVATQKIHMLERDLALATQEIHNLKAGRPDTQNATHDPVDTRLAAQRIRATQPATQAENDTHDDTHGKSDTHMIHTDEATQDATHSGPLKLDGWSIQFSGGYYRGHRRVLGKMVSCYLGKSFDLDQAREKLAARLAALTPAQAPEP